MHERLSHHATVRVCESAGVASMRVRSHACTLNYLSAARSHLSLLVCACLLIGLRGALLGAWLNLGGLGSGGCGRAGSERSMRKSAELRPKCGQFRPSLGSARPNSTTSPRRRHTLRRFGLDSARQAPLGRRSGDARNASRSTHGRGLRNAPRRPESHAPPHTWAGAL